MTFPHKPFRALATFALACIALLLTAATASAALPDPMARGQYGVETMKTFLGGTVVLQEPNASGGAPTGGAAAVTLQLRGSAYYPSDRSTPSPVIVLVHGNHGSCDPGGGSSPFCNDFRRNDEGYAYLGENLASHGYTVLSLDQDQLMAFQDGRASGMHQRRLYIAAALDMLHAANKDELPADADTNIGDRFVGRLDMRRVGLMGHSRGGDAVTSFIDFNRTRPLPGRRYNLRGVIALAPVDYERRAPYGTPHLSILPYCDGDVSNLQGARFYERGQYAMPGDPFPRIQQSVLGTNHNWFNTNWATDADDAAGSATDPACGTTQPTNVRLGYGGYTNGTNGTVDNRGSGDPALMGDQTKVGLATQAAFFRRYVGGEVGFDPYVTGELSAVGAGEQLPASACPTGPSGTRVACSEYVSTAYFPAAAERRDVIGPDPDTPLTASWLGTALSASGFANPYTADGGVQPVPPATASGIDWCNPEPDHFTPGNIGYVGLPTARKGCPLPGASALGGQSNGMRENAPVNHSYGLQLAVAWEDPVAATGVPATIATRIPAASGDVSGFDALTLAAAVNFFDPRNPARVGDALWNASATTQDFAIALTDAAGTTATVAAGDHRYGNALHQSTGTATPRTHVVLGQIRVPLGDFAAQGVDLTALRRLELRFGEAGKPASGSIQLADVRFQEAAGGPTVLADGPAAAPSGVQPIDLVTPVPRVTIEQAGQATAAVATPAAAAAPSAPAVVCADAIAPTVKVGKRGKRTLRGTAADRGCGARVAAVQVTLAKATAGKGRLRFVKPSGALTKPLARTASVALVAKGTTRWSLTLPRKLAPGRYQATVRALDAAGNASAKPPRKTLVVR